MQSRVNGFGQNQTSFFIRRLKKCPDTLFLRKGDDELMTEIIAVVNQKGGVPKTTTVACLGSGLAIKRKKGGIRL